MGQTIIEALEGVHEWAICIACEDEAALSIDACNNMSCATFIHSFVLQGRLGQP